MLVMKFGGSSVADASAMLKVMNIVSAKKSEKIFVVLSACKGITDSLIQIAELASLGKSSEVLILTEAIKNRHFDIIENSISNKVYKKSAKTEIEKLIDELNYFLEGIAFLNELTRQSLDFCLSFGEYLSTCIFNYILQDNDISSKFVDSAKLIRTDSTFGNAHPNSLQIKNNVSNINCLYDQYDVLVAQGFIGSDLEGRITTLGRGGSDYSAALFGAALEADEIQIWTDVSGVLSSDPKLINSAKSIPVLSADEVRELSFFGAKVLHPDTIKPAIEADIPIKVLNTFAPEDRGTVIIKPAAKEPQLHSVSVKHDCTSIRITLKTLNDSISQVIEILSLFKSNKYPLLLISTTESSLILFIENISDVQENAIQMLLSGYSYSQTKGDLVCLVGDSLNSDTAILADITRLSEQIELEYLLYGNNSSAVFAFTMNNSTSKFLNEIHKLIVE